MDVFVHDRTTGQTTRASLDSVGSEGNNESRNPAISSDGSYVAFISDADNLITDDTNSATDVFVHDRTTAQTTRESLGSTSIGGNHESFAAAVSFDGRYVAFHSDADNLITGDGNGRTDVFVHDRGTWQITRVSVDGAGVEGNNNSQYPSISSDGRYVAFGSAASNLVGGDTNGKIDIFIHDRDTGLTTRVSVTSTGTQSNGGSYFPSISGDARYVAFHSDASNLVTGDTNGVIDVFVHDRNTGQTTRVSVDSAGVEGNLTSWYPSISADGRYVAFESYANNLVIDDTNFRWDIFVHDRNTGQTNRVSVDSGGIEGNKDSNNPSISADGRYVAFQSDADNLVTGDTNWSSDVFVHDRTTGQITRASVDSAGVEGNAPSEYPSISSDGSYVAFATSASNLVPDDTNGRWDVFVHDRSTGQTTRASVSSDGIEGNDTSWIPSISADGSYVAFESYANNLVPDDTNGRWDVFIHDYLGFTVSEPVPDIKANGSDGPLTITRSDILSVTVELDSGDYFGDDADWWLVARTPLGWYYYHPISGWLPGRDVTLQIPLRDLPSIEVFNMSGLPTGDYTFYFGVDLVQNGLINLAQAYYDQVSVTINP
jgi:Tol biopolymer transport system component